MLDVFNQFKQSHPQIFLFVIFSLFFVVLFSPGIKPKLRMGTYRIDPAFLKMPSKLSFGFGKSSRSLNCFMD